MVEHADLPELFKPQMAALLTHIGRFRMVIETVMEAVVQSQYDHSEFQQ